MKNKISDLLRKWYNGEIDVDKASIEETRATEAKIHTDTSKEEPPAKIISSLKKKEIAFSAVESVILSVVFCAIFICVLIGTVNFLPGFADKSAPTINEVSDHYVEQGRDQTGAVNTVAGMILDYRAFDTLGESFVLFTATCAVLILMEDLKRKPKPKTEEIFLYANDPIARTVTKILIPIILVFGVYILFNGHLSPGGGFSGGAILGAGFILYAMVFGEEKAEKILSERLIKTVTIVSLSFYCISKSYSFFTGNDFNDLHSVITAGTPGDLFSAGLILPLNIAVGLVVCCTMYSFYMLFKRGKL